LDEDHDGVVLIEQLVRELRLSFFSSDEEASEYYKSFDRDGDGGLDFLEFGKFCEDMFYEPAGGMEYTQSMVSGVMTNIQRNKDDVAKAWRTFAESIDDFAIHVVIPTYLIILVRVANFNSDDFKAWDDVLNPLTKAGRGLLFLLLVYAPWAILICIFFGTLFAPIESHKVIIGRKIIRSRRRS
jgi:hypothetical protein